MQGRRAAWFSHRNITPPTCGHLGKLTPTPPTTPAPRALTAVLEMNCCTLIGSDSDPPTSQSDRWHWHKTSKQYTFMWAELSIFWARPRYRRRYTVEVCCFSAILSARLLPIVVSGGGVCVLRAGLPKTKGKHWEGVVVRKQRQPTFTVASSKMCTAPRDATPH